MRGIVAAVLLSLVVVSLPQGGFAAPKIVDTDRPAPLPQRLIPFELDDQFGTRHTYREFANRALIVIAADGAASGFTDAWSGEIADIVQRLAASDKTAVVGLADLRAVPRFMRANVTKRFPQDPASWTLLDWKGAFANTFDFEKRHCNLLVFGADGAMLLHAAGREVDAGILDQIEVALRAAVGE